MATCGALHPELKQALGLEHEILVADIDLDSLMAITAKGFVYKKLPRVPAVSRDLSLVLDRSVSYREIEETIGRVPAPAPVRFEVIDRYQGPPLREGQSSLTIRAILQPLEQTLTDQESEDYRLRLIDALKKECRIDLRG